MDKADVSFHFKYILPVSYYCRLYNALLSRGKRHKDTNEPKSKHN